MPKKPLDPDTLAAVADRFKVLAEPARLAVLQALRDGQMTVTELIDETGLNQANLSKHLQVLFSHGFVERRRDKSWVYYSLADASVFKLCDIMCGQLDRHVAIQRYAAR
ncbi:MAG: ArsR/SmtB family transcription factor [Acidimicrobiia bacterium]